MHGLDAPLAAGDPGEAGGAGLAGVEACDGVDDFLAGQLAVGVVSVAADPGDARGAGEVQVPGVGDPDGAADDPAVAAVQFRVVGLAGAFLLEGVEDGPLEGGLVALDDYLELPRRPGP